MNDVTVDLNADSIAVINQAVMWIVVLFVLVMLLTWPLRRRVRELRRREPWSLERAMWAQSGVFLTGRIFRKWGKQSPTGKRQSWK